MNDSNTTESIWSQAEQFNSIAPMAEEEFSNFLGLGDIDLDFPLFGAISNGQTMSQAHVSGIPAVMDIEMTNAQFEDSGQRDIFNVNSVAPQSVIPAEVNLVSSKNEMNRFLDQSYNHVHLQSLQPQLQTPLMTTSMYQPRQVVPPTPNSLDINGASRHVPRINTQDTPSMEQPFHFGTSVVSIKLLVVSCLHSG
jgi:hypothetical protein